MMTLPSSSHLIAVVRAEITETLSGISEDTKVLNCLAMVDSMLASIAIRCEHEIGWMISETNEIVDLAEAMIADGRDDGRIAAGLAQLHDRPLASFDTATIRGRYHQASAVLADCAELALAAGEQIRSRVEQALATRLDHEREIRGALAFVGRG
jgi:hypothetical protein